MDEHGRGQTLWTVEVMCCFLVFVYVYYYYYVLVVLIP